MSPRERILRIRLLEKLETRPAWAKALGIEIPKDRNEAKNIPDP